jgi:CheY-like chemotaxis protein
MSTAPLTGRRVLVVEDESLIAMLIEDTLADLGCVVAVSASRLDQGVEAATSAAIDLAVVDVNLAGEPAYPIADALLARAIPFVLTTGYGPAGLRPGLERVPIVTKPFATADLERALLKALGG